MSPPFSSPPTGNISPQDWYLAASAHPDFVHDEAQAHAVQELDLLWHELVDFKARRNHFLGRSLLSPQVPKGLYFWGGVGRGKTFLMDVFFDCVPYQRKRRTHFHRFMAEVHHELKQLADTTDPLLALADNMAVATRLLCLDEFHVTDIGDAMLLGRLLRALFERGVVFMVTSNQAPDDLYLHGLQRQQFLPTIALIKQEMRIVNVEGERDYRLRELSQEPLFLVPADAASDAKMRAMFDRLATRVLHAEKQIDILGRHIPVQRVASGIVWFSFDAICGGFRDQSDYLEIAHQFHTVFISHLPRLNADQGAAAQRLIWLVDVCYDNRVKLVISAANTPDHLYSDGAQSAEFSRTSSRLIEMQSTVYLAQGHQSADKR